MNEKKKNKLLNLNNFIKLDADSDLLIHLALLAICLFGIVMIGSASMGTTVGDFKTLAITIAKQLIFVIVGYCCMAKLSHGFSIKSLKGNTFSYIVIGVMASMVLCLAFPAVKGAKAWIRIPLGVTEVTVQPAEFAKILVYLLIASHMGDRKKNSKETSWDIIKKPLILCGIIFAITLVLQKDFGTMTIQVLLACIVVLIPKNPKLTRMQRILRVLFWFAVILSILILSPVGESVIEKLPLAEYQKNRFYSAINPFQDAYGSGYQVIAGLIAMSEGGWLGKGFGKSVRKYMNFPEANNDFILAIIIEELGFVGFLVLMALYCILIYRLLSYAFKMKSEAGRIILVGSAMYYFLHIFLNVGGITGLIPLTGVPLPLVSSGGSSAIAFMSTIGISQAVIGAYNRKEIQ